MSVAAIVPAAGSGDRLGGGIPKAFRLLAGTTLLRRSADAVATSVDLVVVAVPADRRDVDWRNAAVAALEGAACPTRVVAGGASRQASVAAALAVLPPDVDVVLVHDAARPLMPPAVVAAVIAAVRAGAPGVIPALAVTDTLKSVDASGRVLRTVDRTGLVAVQTPQGFRRDVLERAHRADPGVATDDAALVEALGIPVLTVPGDPAGFKITTPYDVVLAEALLGGGR
ncbi:MAG: 2-C-methyl-D-erythritol 4-phosphate cytidylyltransferase [Geodermatophilaceae bacterium]|nr:2-C-methyl-D-erythritol 4-phosphate cytidylyltransferase [Geodermatophilaceae bacterium]MDQ3465857.1 2-C-methyl-D-erythritol 4-phosphate cytidylyltransferase [Actinomycetota bacterium]